MDTAMPSQFSGHRWQWFGHLTYSQHGEDLLFVATFERLGIREPSYLDIGAYHPTIISNTALLYDRGSSGINVEANPEHVEEFRAARPRDKTVLAGVAPTRGKKIFYSFAGEASGRSSFSKADTEALLAQYPGMKLQELTIDTVTIDDIVREHAAGAYPDLLCIDIEHLDTDVLASADFSISRPKLICVEVLTAPKAESPRIYSLLESRGFARYVRMGNNAIFIDRPLLDLIW